MTDTESRVINFIRQYGLMPGGEMLIVAVSGGADSVCLLHLLARWRDELGVELHVAHLNHELRGDESDSDARYVADLAGYLSLPITVGRQNVAGYRSRKKCSLEEAARELRYSFLAKVAGETGSRRVIVGHTRDDQVETVLMHILRGTGVSGLCGLKPCSPMMYGEGVPLQQGEGNLVVVRPLLELTREETQNYCQEHGLGARMDSSNMSLSFFRNRLRLELLPLLRGYNPNVDEGLLRLAEIAGEDQSFMEKQALQLWDDMAWQEGGAVGLDSKKLCGLSVSLQRQIIRLGIARTLGDSRDIEAKHIELVRALLNKVTGKKIALPRGLVCRTEYGRVILELSPLPCRPVLPLPGETLLEVPGETILPGWRVLASIFSRADGHDFGWGEEARKPGGERLTAEFDLQRTGVELSVRQRQRGDRFQPLGMGMPKKLRRFMVDAKIPRSLRGDVPIVCAHGQVIWVVGWRIGDGCKITDATGEILQLEFIRSL